MTEFHVTLTDKLNLTVHKTNYPYKFAWDKKRGVTDDFWFTPSGYCRIPISCLHNNHVGFISDEMYESLKSELKREKCDFLTDGSNFYTIGDKSIMRIDNASTILYKANQEWLARYVMEGWDIDFNPDFVEE
jgi:hypothetical protein